MSSLAQEESRSISENVTWGQRKSIADDKVSIPYKHFLGYEKGENGQLVVNMKRSRDRQAHLPTVFRGENPSRYLPSFGCKRYTHALWQYTSHLYNQRLNDYGITPSMSRAGTPLDNACAESFFGILKTECIYIEKPQTAADAEKLVDEYIHYYNYERIQLRPALRPMR